MPYIVDFSQTGVMTIGWDRQMKPHENPKEIPPTKIAVEPALFQKSGYNPLKRQLNEQETSSEIWFKEQMEAKNAKCFS